MSLLARFLGDERGGTAVEYALLLGGIAVAVIAALPGLAAKIGGVFGSVSTTLK